MERQERSKEVHPVPAANCIWHLVTSGHLTDIVMVLQVPILLVSQPCVAGHHWLIRPHSSQSSFPSLFLPCRREG